MCQNFVKILENEILQVAHFIFQKNGSFVHERRGYATYTEYQAKHARGITMEAYGLGVVLPAPYRISGIICIRWVVGLHGRRNVGSSATSYLHCR